VRPLGAAFRRARARPTPPPAGDRPPLPEGIVELDTLSGTFWFDESDSKLTPWIREHATWEADVIRLLERTLQPGDVFVDVGANIGFHSVIGSRLVGPGGRVFALEPLPWTVDVLRANVWRHRGGNITVVPAAASDAVGTATLTIPREGRSGAGLDLGQLPGASETVEVVTTTLDDLLGELPVSVLKIDVEGAELRVLAGAANVLERSPAIVLVVEFRPNEVADGLTPAQVLERFASLGLEPCLLRRDGSIKSASPAEILSGASGDAVMNIALRRR
jgi:FkbM family methyltransferase